MRHLFPIFPWLLAAGLLHAGNLTFERTDLDFKLPPDADKVTADFRFENKTGKPVTIAKVEKTCSCQSVTVEGGKLVYQPGEKGTIRAEFDLGNFFGEIVKQTVLWETGDPADKPSVVLTMTAHIPVLVDISQKTTTWKTGEAPIPQKCVVRIKHDQPIRVLQVKCSSDLFAVKWHAVREGAEYEIEITPTSTASPAMGVIHVETDCGIQRHRKHLIYAVVRAPVPQPVRQTAPP